MADKIYIQGPFRGQAALCEPILRSLPQWFGIEAATAQYVRDIEAMPTLVALAGRRAVGFVTIKQHNEYSAEIHVIGVHPELHRRGIGRVLVARAEEYLRQRGVEYLQVKTLSASRPDEHYERTRRFYLAMGFRPLEEFKKLWDEANPCLQMIKRL